MQYSFIAYILVSIMVTLAVFSTMNSSGRAYSAIGSIVLFTLIFLFYGQRWFKGGKSTFSYSGAWPPMINMCPDYLVYIKRGTADACADLLGVNRSNGLLKPWTKDDTPANPPQDPAKYFPYVYKRGMTNADKKRLCDAAIANGLTWEGITNGESCTYLQKFSAAAAATAAAPGDQCPQ